MNWWSINMSEVVIDITKESRAAEEAAQKIDYKLQFNIPDFERQLKAAYIHGYRDALVNQKIKEMSK